MKENTPPASPHVPDEEDDLIYVGDVDEVIEDLENEDQLNEDEENELLNEPMDDSDVEIIPERDDSLITFKAHKDSLFCGSFHPSGDYVATGGEDDKAYVWSTTTGEVIFEVTGHKDSVIAAEFSNDGNYLATGDMAGDIKAFRVDKEYKKVWDFSMGDMSWMKWHSKANVLMAGAESGEIYIWRIPSGDCKVLGGEGAKCEVGVLTSDDKRLATGYSDGSIKVWDIKDQSVVLHIPPEKNRDGDVEMPQSITTLDTDSENLIVTGSENGLIKLVGSSGIVGILNTNPSKSASSSAEEVEPVPVEKVLVDCPDFDIKVAVTGSLNGKVIIWDVKHQTVRNECKDEFTSGITTMVWAKDQTVIAGTIGGSIKAWNVRNGESKFTLFGHTHNIHDLAYHKQKNLLLSVSEDKTAKIFSLPM